MDAKREAYWWWFDSHNTPKYSPWLRSTLAELDEKTKAMLKLIEEDADSFAQRAEMYYKKRPELITMVEGFYRSYRSLAERYDQQKWDPVNRVKSPLRHSMPDFGFKSITTTIDTTIGNATFFDDAFSEEEEAVSDVDDPTDEEDHDHDHDEVVIDDGDDHDHDCEELMRLRNEVESLKSERASLRELVKKKDEELDEVKCELVKVRGEMKVQNECLEGKLVEKDEEKREVIRQLSLGMQMLREENEVLMKRLMKGVVVESGPSKKNGGLNEAQGFFKGLVGLGSLLGLAPKSQTSVVPL